MSDETGPETGLKETETIPTETHEPVPEPGQKLDFGTCKSAVKCMISFFTIIRLDVGQKEFDAMEKNFWLVPALGFFNGFVAFLVCTILGLCGMGTLVQAVGALVSMYFFSKFLHFDGLTDFGDGIIVSSGKREDHIRALKDSLIGAGGFGVALSVILITVALYNQLGGLVTVYYCDYTKYLGIGMVAFCVEILVKNAQVAAASFGEPGNGMASRQVRCTTKQSLVKSVILTVVLLAIATLVGYGVSCIGKAAGGIGLAEGIVLFIVALLMSVLVGYLMARKANKTFGFVNGDILGATNEISRACILLVCALILGLW